MEHRSVVFCRFNHSKCDTINCGCRANCLKQENRPLVSPYVFPWTVIGLAVEPGSWVTGTVLGNGDGSIAQKAVAIKKDVV